MRAARENSRYLPGVTLPASIEVTADADRVAGADLLIAATPVAALESVARDFAARGARAPLAWLSKGFVAGETGPELAHRRLAPLWPAPVAVGDQCDRPGAQSPSSSLISMRSRLA